MTQLRNWLMRGQHSEINTLDLRSEHGQMRDAMEALRIIVEAIKIAYESAESWIEWDEIEWSWKLTTLNDFRRRAMRRDGYYHLRTTVAEFQMRKYQ